ncbi:MAG: FtsX-like permease family protein [Prevotella sp.]|nr:FtsX-like permease family protein [Prevotella sp.]
MKLSFLFKHAWRQLSRMRTYTFINAVGLIVSLTGAIIIARYVHQELTVDDYMPEVDRTGVICRCGTDSKSIYGADIIEELFTNIKNPLKDADIDCVTSFVPICDLVSVAVDETQYLSRAIAADSMFLNVFPRKALAGVLKMQSPEDAIVSEAFAKRVWGEEEAVGKKLRFSSFDLVVKGVAKSTGVKCNFDFDILVRNDLNEYWIDSRMSACRLHEGADVHEFNKRYALRQTQLANPDGYERTDLTVGAEMVLMKDLYFESIIDRWHDEWFMPAGNRTSIAILVFAACLLLTVGIFNFVNIYGIVMLKRRKSMGVRMVFGASLWDVFKLIWMENTILFVIVTLVASVVALAVSDVLSVYYSIEQIPSPVFDCVLFACFAICLPFITSVVTTIGMMRSDSVDVMQGEDAKVGRFSIRDCSLAVQYLVSFFLIVVSTYSLMQLRYMLNVDYGYSTSDIISFCTASSTNHTDYDTAWEYENGGNREESEVAIIEAVKRSPLFEKVSAWLNMKGMSPVLTEDRNCPDMGFATYTDEKGKRYPVAECKMMTKDLLDIFDIEVIEGKLPTDEELEGSLGFFYLTESTQRMYGIENIAGKQLEIEGNMFLPIYGVVNDVRFRHVASEDKPRVLLVAKRMNTLRSTYIAKIKAGKREEAVAFLKDQYAKHYGADSEIEYMLIEDEFQKLYADDARTVRIYTTFALLSIFISCLGLFGISLYDIQHRRREIALRRVHGAMLRDVLRLMMKRYVIALIVATAVGTPLAIYALHFYIEGYAHHVALTPWYFIAAFLIMLLLTFVTIYWQVRKAMKEDPADVLKSE